MQSPVGMVPKGDGSLRLIFHLSYSRSGKDSINDHTPPELCSVRYKDLDNAIKLCMKEGVGTYLAKSDMKSAFRNLPINPQDRK